MSDDVGPAERSARFEFGARRIRGGVAEFEFRCSRFGSFRETAALGTEGAVPDALLTLLQVALGVSTYKAGAAREVVFPPLTKAGRLMAEALYTEGLAEFFVRSGFPYPPSTVFKGDTIPAAATESGTKAEGPALIAFGGGKDSYVAGRIMKEAHRAEPQFASVVLSDAVRQVLIATAPHTPLFVERSLDPKLLSLQGAFGGHVPITAINILVLTIAGMLRGFGTVIFANERSADEPTLTVNGAPANHQYSKSSFFEQLVREAVSSVAPAAPVTYSVLRPFSELWIAARFSQIKEAFPRFTSCNRNFRLAGDADKRWCGACPKCAFTSLVLTPFLSQAEHHRIFGQTMLDQEALQPFYRELCGLSDQKPWECVGTINECQAALHLLAQDERWQDTRVVSGLMTDLRRVKDASQLDKQVEDALRPDPRGALPIDLYTAAMRLP